jgi:flagellar biosynthesis chaperone FliJ
MSGGTDPLREQKQLLKLRQLREDAARLVREQCRQAVEAAAQAVRSREVAIRRLRDDQARLRAWAPAARDTHVAMQASMKDAAVLRLREQIDQAELALDEERKALATAETELAHAHTAWTAACTRHRSVEEWVRRSARLMATEAERLAEREIDGSGRPAAGGPCKEAAW